MHNVVYDIPDNIKMSLNILYDVKSSGTNLKEPSCKMSSQNILDNGKK